MEAAAARVMADKVPAALAVAPTEGQWVAARSRCPVAWRVAPQRVMITAGAQEGIDLLCTLPD